MDAEDILKIIRSQIGDRWETTNWHEVNLQKSLVHPKLISVIDRQVRNGEIQDQIINGWLVLVENPESQSGLRIVANQDGTNFGLAQGKFPSDQPLIIFGWYGDFLSAFTSM